VWTVFLPPLKTLSSAAFIQPILWWEGFFLMQESSLPHPCTNAFIWIKNYLPCFRRHLSFSFPQGWVTREQLSLHRPVFISDLPRLERSSRLRLCKPLAVIHVEDTVTITKDSLWFANCLVHIIQLFFLSDQVLNHKCPLLCLSKALFPYDRRGWKRGHTINKSLYNICCHPLWHSITRQLFWLTYQFVGIDYDSRLNSSVS